MKKLQAAFTLVELLTVIMVIAVLAGLVLSTAGYVQKKAATSRATAEIAALSAACESYKADNGIYPRENDSSTDNLNARASGDPNSYKAASLFLYKQLSGDVDNDADRKVDPEKTVYFEFPPKMLSPTLTTSPKKVDYIQDPFGYAYGYSTANQKFQENPSGAEKGYNPTFDLWSTSGGTKNDSTATARWIKNW